MKTLSTATIRAAAVPWKQSITTGNHQLVGDEGKGGGGQDAGPAPYDYLLASLGSCTAITLQMYAQHKGWELVGLEVELSLTKDNDGEVHIHRTLTVRNDLTEEQQQKLLNIAGKTPVTKTLLAGVSIDTSY